VQKFMAWLAQRNHVPLIQELHLQADTWRQIELSRARKRIDKGQSVDSVLEALSMGLMKKMLNGPLRELHHAESPHIDTTRDVIRHMFLKAQ